MADPYWPLVDIRGHGYFPPPYSAPELPATLRTGLIPIATCATISVVSTTVLIMFIAIRFITWRLHYKSFIGYNQYIVLVLNLLIADLQQSAAFLISWHWYRKDQILAPSAACFAQGWLLHSGDVSSGFFVMGIAVHTYYTAVLRRRIGGKMFGGFVVGIWLMAYFLTVIGVALHREKYFVRAGAWCWVSSAFEGERLWCHYLWVFGIELGTILIYLTTFYALRKKTRNLMVNGEIPPNSPNANTIKALNRITLNMVLYPCVYVLLTLPLSAGRMWSMSRDGRTTSDVFSCIAGSLLTSCGWVDSLLYTLTRGKLLRDTMPKDEQVERATGDSNRGHQSSAGITHTRTITVESATLQDCDDISINGSHAAGPGQDRIVPSASGTLDPILPERLAWTPFNASVVTEISSGSRRHSRRCSAQFMCLRGSSPVCREPGPMNFI